MSIKWSRAGRPPPQTLLLSFLSDLLLRPSPTILLLLLLFHIYSHIRSLDESFDLLPSPTKSVLAPSPPRNSLGKCIRVGTHLYSLLHQQKVSTCPHYYKKKPPHHFDTDIAARTHSLCVHFSPLPLSPPLNACTTLLTLEGIADMVCVSTVFWAV